MHSVFFAYKKSSLLLCDRNNTFAKLLYEDYLIFGDKVFIDVDHKGGAIPSN